MNRNKNKRTKPASFLRKEFYRRLVYMGLCLIPMWFLLDETGGLRFVALFFFFLLMAQLMLLISMSQDLVDDFFPPKLEQEQEQATSFFSTFMYYATSILFFCSLVLMGFELPIIENTIHGSNLFWKFGLIGLGIAIFITILLKRIRPEIYYVSKRRYTIHFCLFLGLFLTVPVLASMMNRYVVKSALHCDPYAIDHISKNATYDTPYLFIRVGDDTERFEVSPGLYDKVQEDEFIQLCTITGFLGYKVVQDFKE